MKAWLLSGFVIALLTGGAFAQANGQPPERSRYGGAAPTRARPCASTSAPFRRIAAIREPGR